MLEWTPIEFNIIQLDFSAVFDRVSHSGLLFKSKSIGVAGTVLAIHREFLSTVYLCMSNSQSAQGLVITPQGSVLPHKSDPMLNSVLNGDWNISAPGRQFPKGLAT